MSTCRVKSNSIQTAPCWKRLAMMVKAMVGEVGRGVDCGERDTCQYLPRFLVNRTLSDLCTR